MSQFAHTVLRMALTACACDPASDLQAEQRAWCLALPTRRTPFTPDELARLQPVVLGWATARMPGCVAVLQQGLATTEKEIPNGDLT